MENTDKAYCREIASLLVEHGVEQAVLCPGSRNAPLIVAISRAVSDCYSVIDERSAAFIALGLASISGKPVAIVCTSGSAVLNFAPAVAEAYYRRVPLIVISADRPTEWIDQDDSQTIRQPGILRNIVKECYNVPVEAGSASQAWLVNRTVNDAIIMAKTQPQGPVHVNVQLADPLGRIAEASFARPRKISVARPASLLPEAEARRLGEELASPRRVMVIAGFMPPSLAAEQALNRLAERPNVVVLHEAQANVHGPELIGNIDSALSILTAEQKRQLVPDVVVTVGGSLVSRFVKAWLREAANSPKGLTHWHVGQQPYSVDCFMGLSLRIEMEASDFLPQLAAAMPRSSAPSSYGAQWAAVAAEARARDKSYLAAAPWSDYKAMALIMQRMPRCWNLQLSNGTAVRYAQLFDYSGIHRIDCNRGVSGIDGCTSTAIGAALAYPEGTTLLVTGDMSAQYDLGALAANCIPATLKIAVLNNQGGGIFRFVQSTANLPELDEYFCGEVRLPLADLAHGFAFHYFEASDAQEFLLAWTDFAYADGPAIINIVTPPQVSAETLKNYFTRQ